jgi:SulP family sulfate permease
MVSDMVAGVTLGIESIPDAMASALLAAVNPIHGVYAVMLATPVGALFASSVFMSVQTTSAMSLIVASVPEVRGGEDAMASLLALAIVTGVIMLALGLAKLGTMLRFVPNSVMTGFINGVAILIVLGQLGNLTGYDPEGPNKVVQTIDLLFNLNEIDLPTLMVGIATILLIIALERTRLKSFGIVVALVVASLLVPLFNWDSVALVADIADIPGSLPRPTLPPLSVFPAMIIPGLSLALVGLIQGAGVSQNYVNPDGEYPDPSGDFVGQGVANVAAGVFQGMPVGGSLSATALVHSSGAKTRFANIFAGITIAVALLILGDAISAMAMPALAGLLIVVGVGTLKLDDINMVWKTGRIQQVVMLITLVFTLLIPLQYAVLIGVALAILLFVFEQSNKVVIKQWEFTRGGLPIETDAPELLEPDSVVVLAPFGSLFFAAAASFEEQLPVADDNTRNCAVVLNLHGKTELGSTLLGVLERYSGVLQEHDSRLMLAEVGRVTRRVIDMTGQVDVYGRDNVYMATEVVAASLIEALHDAEQWVAGNVHSTQEHAAQADSSQPSADTEERDSEVDDEPEPGTGED